MLTRNREVYGSPKYLEIGSLWCSSTTLLMLEGFVVKPVSTVAGLQFTANFSNLGRNDSNRFH